MIGITLDCLGLTHSSVIRIIHCNVGLKCFFSFTLIFDIVVSFLTFIFYEVVYRHIYGMVGNIIIILLQIVCKE